MNDTMQRPSTVGPPKERKGGALRQTGKAILMVALLGVVVVGSTTVLGKNASSKFSSVASAICDVRVDVPGGRVPAGELRPPLAVIADVADVSAEQESACGGGGLAAPSVNSPRVASTTVTAPAPPQTIGAPAANVTADATPSSVPVLSMGPSAAGHEFISTATMTVKVDDADVVNAKKEEAIRLIEGSGGGLFGEQTSFNGEAHATVTFKVPPEKFRPVLSELAALGELQQQEVKTDDVTQQVIDLDARITVAQESLDRMRGLLSKASDLNQVATLEADVGRRQTELEQLKGEQQTLGQRVSLATIVLTLSTSSSTGSANAGAPVTTVATPTTTTTKAPRPLPGFSDGLENGWHVFTVGGSVVLACVGALLPFVPLVVIVGVPWLVVRRRRNRQAPRPATVPAG
jgi:hypothetical protein